MTKETGSLIVQPSKLTMQIIRYLIKGRKYGDQCVSKDGEQYIQNVVETLCRPICHLIKAENFDRKYN